MSTPSKYRPPEDIPLIDGLPEAGQRQLQVFLRRQFLRLAEDLSTATRNDAPTIVFSDTRLDVPAGAKRRLTPPKAGMTVVLEAPSQFNAGEEVVLFNEGPRGTLVVISAPGIDDGGKVFLPQVNGARQATYIAAGVITLRSNGSTAWSSPAEIPAESPASFQALIVSSPGATGAAGAKGAPGAAGAPAPPVIQFDDGGPTIMLPFPTPLPMVRPGSSLGLQVSATGSNIAIEITGANSGENIRYANAVTDTTSSGAVGVYVVSETVNTVAITAPAPLTISGATVLSDGKEVTFYNAGINPITLKQEDLSVAAASRFSLPRSVDLVLSIGDAAVVRNTIGRWRCLDDTVGLPAQTPQGPAPQFTIDDDGAPLWAMPGPPGAAGAAGATGATGPTGPSGSGSSTDTPGAMLPIDDDSPAFNMPGPPGPTGPAGANGVAGSVLNTATVNFGAVAQMSGSFDITGLSGLVVNTPIEVSLAVNPLDPTEAEQSCVITGYAISATTIRCYWNAIDRMQGNHPVQYIVSTATGNLTLSPGQFVGLPIDAGASGPAVAISGAQGGENLRLATIVADTTSSGNVPDYAFVDGTTEVNFTPPALLTLQGLALGGTAPNGRLCNLVNTAGSGQNIVLAHASAGEATASRKFQNPAALDLTLFPSESAVAISNQPLNRKRIFALARARHAVQLNAGAISPAETLKLVDSASADFLPTLSVAAGVASISANLGYQTQAGFDVGIASALPLAANLRGFPGSFCSNQAALTAINGVARNATLGHTPSGGVDVLQSIPAISAANAGQAYLLYGFFTVARGGTGTACNITWDAQCAGVTQTEVPAVAIPVALNTRYGGMMLALLHIETLGVAGTATLRTVGIAGNITQAFADLASSGSLVTPFTINTTATNTVSLGMTMSAAVANLQTSWNSCGIIKLYV